MTAANRVSRLMLLTLAGVGILFGLAVWGVPASATVAGVGIAVQSPAQPREVRVVAHRYSYSPDRIEVQEGDLVKVTLDTEDIPHSFTVDEPYRIAKRATPGHPVVFEFRADQAGTFPFYCNLTAEDGCKNMRGQLIVRAKR